MIIFNNKELFSAIKHTVKKIGGSIMKQMLPVRYFFLRKKYPSRVGNFIDTNMRSPNSKSQPLSVQTEYEV